MPPRIALALALLLFSCPSVPGADSPPKQKRPRVLLFASSPTRDYQFLRSLLVRETDARRAELTICLQPPPGRDEPRGSIVQDVPAERLLSTFPARLDSYDAIVAFDPDWGRLAPETQRALKKWVEVKGGGLVLVAGPVNTYTLARKDSADKFGAILDLYPVVSEDARTLPAIEFNRPRRLTFSPRHGESSFLKLDEKGEGPLAGWDDFFNRPEKGAAKRSDEPLRGFYSYTPVRSVKPGAVVLATLVDPKARLKNGQDQPYLVTMPAGKGRVVYLSSGETWRLRQRRTQYHERFWLALLSYVAGTSATEKPKEPPRPEGLSAADLKLQVQVLRTLYSFRCTPEQIQALAGVATQRTK